MKNLSKLEDITTNIVKSIFLIIIIFLTICSIMISASVTEWEHSIYCNDNIFLNIVCITLVCALATFIKIKKIKVSKNAIYIVSIAWFIICVAWVFMRNLYPNSDQFMTLNAGQQILNGNFESLEQGGYLYIYPQQYGLTLIFMAITFLFNDESYQVIQIINIFALLTAIYSLYKISNLLYKNNNVSKYIIILLYAFIPISMYITFVYGNLLGLALSCLAILFQLKYFKEEKKIYILGAVLFSTIAVLIKSNYLINLVAMIILFITEAIFKKKAKYLISVILIILCYMLLTQSVNFVFKKITNINRNEGTPIITWVAMGLQEGPLAEGWYNRYNLDTYVINNYSSEKTTESAKNSIKQSMENFIKNPDYAINFFYKKILSQWNNSTFQCIWINHNVNTEATPSQYNLIVKSMLEDGILGKIIVKYTDFLQTIILSGTLMYIILDYKNIKLKELVFAIIFIGGFIFHIVWEAKGQYTITYFVLLIPYSMFGYDKISNMLYKNYIQNKQKLLKSAK